MTAMVAAATLVACGGDDGGTEPTPEINIALSTATLSIVQGANGTATVTLTRAGGFTGDVAIAVEGLPTGVTAPPVTIGAASTTGIITLTAAATATPATTNLTVRATGTGVTAKTAALALTVTAAPTYTVAVSPATRTIAQGATATVDVTLTRTGGFAGMVTLAATGLPAGVTGAFNPTSLTANASVLTLTAAANATVGGPTTVTVTGTAIGQADKTATFQLTITAVTAGGYTIAVTPATVGVVQGATTTANVALTRTGGFAGAVTFAVEGLPAGVTGAFNPNNTTTDASVLTLTAAANATVGGPTTVTVKGTATGQTDKTATFQLNVTAAPVGGFTLALAPTTVGVQQGGTGTSTVTITRTAPFAGAVTLTATGLPNGVTAAFNPAAPTTNTSTLTLTATATATVGQATVTVRGNATGIAEQTVALTVNVTAVTGGTGNTVFEFCTAADTPIWLAVQDGTGAWTRVTPTGTKFQFNIASGRGGVAYVTPTSSPIIASQRTLAKRMSAAIETTLLVRNKAAEVRAGRDASRYTARASSLVDGFETSIFYATQTELNALGTTQCLPGTGKTVNGSVANVGASQTAEISLGDASASASAANPNFTLENVPDGALDLIASRSTFDLQTFQTTVDKLIIRRGVTAANNSTLPLLDFNAAEAFAPAQANITVANLGTDAPIVTTTYFTSSGTTGAALFSGFGIGTGPFKYYGVPTAQQVAGDLHFAFVLAVPSSQTATDARFMGVFFKDAVDRTITLGSTLPAQTVSVLAPPQPYVRLRATGSVTAAYSTLVEVDYIQETTARDVIIFATAGYLSNATTYDFTIPDFSGVAGWNNDWALKPAAAIDWSVSGIGFSGGVLSPNPVEGTTLQGAIKLGTITP